MIMAQFEEVLDGVRLALTRASPAEIQALLKGLVEERIISEAYCKSLSLHSLTEGIAPEPACGETAFKPGSGLMNPSGSYHHWHLNRGQHSLVSRKSAATDHNQTPVNEHNIARSGPKMYPPVMDSHYLNPRLFSTSILYDYEYGLESHDEIAELLTIAKSVQKPNSESERINEGNLEDEKEWLQQVEEAARRIAVPLWQHWDRGQRMLLPLVPCMTTGFAASAYTAAADSGVRCPVLSMEEETELVMACRTLDLYADNFSRTEANITDPEFLLDIDGATDTPDGFYLSTSGLNRDRFSIAAAARSASPVETCASRDTKSGITDRLEDDLDVSWLAERKTDTTEDLLCFTGDIQSQGFTEDIAHLFSSCAPENTHTDARNNLFHSNTDHNETSGVLDEEENVFMVAYDKKMCSSTNCITDIHEDTEDKRRVDSHWGAKMQEVDQDLCFFPDLDDLTGLTGVKMLEEDQDPCNCPDLGDLPEDLSEYFDENYLKEDVLFSDPWLNGVDDFNGCSDVPMPTEVASPDSCQQRQDDKLTRTTNNKRKRPRVTQPQRCTTKNTPSRPKRQRAAAGRPKTKEPQTEPPVIEGVDAGPEPSPAEMVDPSTITPPRLLPLYPSFQFITIPDTPGYRVVQTLSLSPPVIRLPLPNTAATPTLILVPAASPPRKLQVPPLSPVDGAVAPVQMSSSPPGSLSDTASKAMSSHCASPVSPSNEMSPCKESPLPPSPTVPDIPQVVKDYIQEVKAHMSQTCPDMEPGLSLTSHYVDVQLSQKEILRSGKNSNKLLDKELVIMGETDQQKSLLRHSQIFESSNGEKSKRYILLLGNAGMGKTTLIRKLCNDWSRDCIPQFDFVFLLDGKALTLTEQTFSLQTLLLNLSSFAPPCMDPDAVYSQILAANKRVLIIFDGFDNLRDYESLLQTQEKDLVTSLQRDSKAQTYTVRQLYSAILQRVLLPGCTLLLSTRPRGTATQLLRRTDSFLEMCGFTPTDIETYLSQYFTDPVLRASALDCLKTSNYLHLLCWNPGLCRLVCLVLEQSKNLGVLPRTLTGLCHQVLHLKMEKDGRMTNSQTEPQTEMSVQDQEKTQAQILTSSQVKSCHKNAMTKSRARVNTRNQRARRTKKQGREEDKENGEELKSVGGEADRIEDIELLSQLSSLAWEGVKANSSTVPKGRTLSAKLKAFGHRTGLFLSYQLRMRQFVSSTVRNKGGGENKEEIRQREEEEISVNRGSTNIDNTDARDDDHVLFWANPFLQSYLAGVHLSMSRTVSDRTFLQTLPFQSGPKGRRRPQREELELSQQFAVGLLFHNRTELQRLQSYKETALRDMLVGKQALVVKHLEGLSHGDLIPAQVLEACHYVYEASCTNGDGSRDGGSTKLVAHLAANLPEVLTFRGVPLNPSDVYAVQNVLERGGAEGRSFSLDLEDSGIHISGLRALAGLNNISTYRACIADVITLWEQLEQSGEEGLLQGAVSKLKIQPFKVTQVCHMEHLAKLVNIHLHKRLSDSSSQSDSILAEGVPAVKELHKLEFELGPENGPLALPKLWELLPGLHNLEHLDLENSKIGDKGAEKLADALVSLCFLEVLNLSQNCIGDQGVKRLSATLKDLPKLHCLSLYSNVISDEGAESLAAVLPHMACLTDLDVEYNKLTDVGAQSLGVSLRNCKKMKTLRMWNQFIPLGVFERLKQQDHRILCH